MCYTILFKSYMIPVLKAPGGGGNIVIFPKNYVTDLPVNEVKFILFKKVWKETLQKFKCNLRKS